MKRIEIIWNLFSCNFLLYQISCIFSCMCNKKWQIKVASQFENLKIFLQKRFYVKWISVYLKCQVKMLVLELYSVSGFWFWWILQFFVADVYLNQNSEPPKLISRKICVAEKFLNFQIVCFLGVFSTLLSLPNKKGKK